MKDFLIVLLVGAMFIAVAAAVITNTRNSKSQSCIQAGGVPVIIGGVRIICFAPGVTIEYR